MKLNIVPARMGLHWVRLGIKTFFRQPLALTSLFFMYTAAASVLSLLPVVGIVLALAIVPAATLGLMAATKEAESGRFPTPAVLVSAFRTGRQRLRAMLVLGVIYAAACLAILALVPLIVSLPATEVPADAEAAMSPQFQLAVLVGAALYLPVSLMFWHAPALVHWHGITPLKSLFFSTVACLRNAGAMTLFGLGWMGIMFIASSAIVMVAAATGNPQVAATALVPAVLLMTAMFTTSFYFTFRDSFVATPDEETTRQPGEPP